jgi:hypothetical protein
MCTEKRGGAPGAPASISGRAFWARDERSVEGEGGSLYLPIVHCTDVCICHYMLYLHVYLVHGTMSACF